MKILAVSDVVVSLLQSAQLPARLQGIDLLVSCGDLPFDYLEYLVSRFNKPLYYVFGNHALHETLRHDDSVKTAPEGCINLHRRVLRYRGLLLGGLEGSLRYNEGSHQYTQREMAWFVRALGPTLAWNRLRYGRSLDILVTHAPPLGIHDGPDLAHRGFAAFVPFIARHRPRYLLHGHTHLYRENGSRAQLLGNTAVVNTYGYQVIELDVPGCVWTEP